MSDRRRCGWQPSERKASAGRRILIKPSWEQGATRRKTSFSFMYEAASGYSSSSVSQLLMSMHTTWGIMLKCRFPCSRAGWCESHWCRNDTLHSEAWGLNAPEVHRDSPLRISGHWPPVPGLPAHPCQPRGRCSWNDHFGACLLGIQIYFINLPAATSNQQSFVKLPEPVKHVGPKSRETSVRQQLGERICSANSHWPVRWLL